jgi:tetratricopeptide (TPR) repeat protein
MHTPTRTARLSCLVLILLTLAGCASAPRQTDSSDEASNATPPPAAPEPAREPVYKPFPDEAIYPLLVAELSARSGHVDVALENYLQQARATHDPGVAAQATRIARYLKNPEATLEASLIWAGAEPGSPEARYTAATELTRAGRLQEAMAQMQALRATGAAANFTAIAASALDAPEADRRALLATLAQLGEKVTNDVLVARAVLAQSLGDNDGALALTGRVLKEEPGNYQAVLIEAQVYQNRGETPKALTRIKAALEVEPGNDRLRLQYARMLARTDLDGAAEQYSSLLRNAPDDAELRLSLALVYREKKDFARMRTELEALLAAGRQEDAAHVYLGEDDERQGNADAAMDHYLSVRPSPAFPMAITRAGELQFKAGGAEALDAAMNRFRLRWPEHATRIVLMQSELLVEHTSFDAAWDLLSTALAAEPGDTALLYARSMVAEKRRDIPGLERDLREMIRLDPSSALALNALGYSLTNLTDRHAEALDLISRALALKPDDPAILDSMGWAHFRLGQLDKALGYLQDAFARFPDHEVAAHLGEVLWIMGRKDEAMDVWKKGLKGRPDSAVVREALKRLGAPEPKL